MKKFLYIALLLSACNIKNNDGIYVNHTNGQYSVVDDTLIIRDTVVINHTGFQKIRNGQLLPKAYKTRQWTLHSPDAPPMIVGEEIQIGNTIYTKLP
ncbi:hypothetical protein [Mucilaginibacter sp. UYCu711]|uniref:hypothetical protein n=1 Tax=Mucilaginibacter sp. UYCu711 TaxID=3156339 RepID=UPI003D2094E0